MNISDLSSPAEPEQVFRALADRLRLRILLLLDLGECCVGDLVAALAAPQANVSRHLARLQLAGLVAVRPQGQWRHYRLRAKSDPALKALLQAVRARRGQLGEAESDRRRLDAARARGGCCPAPNGKATT